MSCSSTGSAQSFAASISPNKTQQKLLDRAKEFHKQGKSAQLHYYCSELRRRRKYGRFRWEDDNSYEGEALARRALAQLVEAGLVIVCPVVVTVARATYLSYRGHIKTIYYRLADQAEEGLKR